MTAPSPTTAVKSSWEQRSRSAPPNAEFKPEYQELKFTLHRKLLERINLEALSGVDDDRIRADVRQAVLAMVEEEPNLLTAAEKQRVSHQVLHEVFGLGPLEPLLRTRPSPTYWSTAPTRSMWSARDC
jgi:pilus assembly protein CpaF